MSLAYYTTSTSATSVSAQRLGCRWDVGLILIDYSSYSTIVDRVRVASVTFVHCDTLFFNDLRLGYFRSVLRFSHLPSSSARRRVGRSYLLSRVGAILILLCFLHGLGFILSDKRRKTLRGVGFERLI